MLTDVISIIVSAICYAKTTTDLLIVPYASYTNSEVSRITIFTRGNYRLHDYFSLSIAIAIGLSCRHYGRLTIVIVVGPKHCKEFEPVLH